jgi:hypothetical protein
MAGGRRGRFSGTAHPVLATIVGGRTDPPGPRYRRLTIGWVYLPTAAELILALVLFLGGNANLLSENVRIGHPHAGGPLTR